MSFARQIASYYQVKSQFIATDMYFYGLSIPYQRCQLNYCLISKNFQQFSPNESLSQLTPFSAAIGLNFLGAVSIILLQCTVHSRSNPPFAHFTTRQTRRLLEITSTKRGKEIVKKKKEKLAMNKKKKKLAISFGVMSGLRSRH
ncbi:hypothetical protein CEXT_798701 [Caerostris extrusa]|uniref:Uncharacterized protein n=1 Tax=Caerostris extrusa TaxID=172846 RepID=A0AAV4XWI7_CAEEX|nr:hypothetical protein CEXT_798701 [Caerostris extrusa]